MIFKGFEMWKIRQAIWKLGMIKKNWKWKGALLLKLQCTTPLHVRVTRKSILVKMSNIRSLHQLYAELTVFLYNTFTHVRKGSVNFDLTWRKWVVKLRKWGLYASFTPPLRSLKFLFSCCVTSLKRALFMLHLLVHFVSVRRTYWKKDSWQINSKSSGKSILRRPPKIALTVYTVSSFYKHFCWEGWGWGGWRKVGYHKKKIAAITLSTTLSLG